MCMAHDTIGASFVAATKSPEEFRTRKECTRSGERPLHTDKLCEINPRFLVQTHEIHYYYVEIATCFENVIKQIENQ